MGDPKFSRKTYDTPSHPWQGERIKAEVEVVRAFGLKNKTEVWKAETILRNLRKQSRDLQARLRTGRGRPRLRPEEQDRGLEGRDHPQEPEEAVQGPPGTPQVR